jgi:hypothetical protein
VSIYGTVCSIDDPITYYGSHVHPYEDHPRDGNVDVAIIPDHIEDHDDIVRLAVHDASGGNACVLLTREQAHEIGRALMGLDPDDAATEPTPHDQHHGHNQEDTDG